MKVRLIGCLRTIISLYILVVSFVTTAPISKVKQASEPVRRSRQGREFSVDQFLNYLSGVTPSGSSYFSEPVGDPVFYDDHSHVDEDEVGPRPNTVMGKIFDILGLSTRRLAYHAANFVMWWAAMLMIEDDEDYEMWVEQQEQKDEEERQKAEYQRMNDYFYMDDE